MFGIFERPYLILLIPLAWLLIHLILRQRSGLGFSASNLHRGALFLPLMLVQKFLLLLVAACAFLILAGPHEVRSKMVPVSKEVRDFVFVLDVSGSMTVEKLDEAREVIRKFVESRPTDCFVLLSFADQADLRWPSACEDRRPFLAKLEGSTGSGGTNIDVGLLFALEFVRKYGRGETALTIVSDGDSRIDERLAEKITALAEETGVHLYWIWIGSEGLTNPTSAAYKDVMNFKAFVERLGGLVYQTAPGEIGAAFAEISRLEPTPITMEERPYAVYNFGRLPLLLIVSLMGIAALELLTILELREGDLG